MPGGGRDDLAGCPPVVPVLDLPCRAAADHRGQVGGQAAGVVEQPADLDGRVAGRKHAGQVTLDRLIEADTAFGGELKHDRGGEYLGDAAYPESRVGRNPLPGVAAGHPGCPLPTAGGAAHLDNRGGRGRTGQAGDRRGQGGGLQRRQPCLACAGDVETGAGTGNVKAGTAARAEGCAPASVPVSAMTVTELAISRFGWSCLPWRSCATRRGCWAEPSCPLGRVWRCGWLPIMFPPGVGAFTLPIAESFLQKFLCDMIRHGPADAPP